jgi:hypothetical protein
MSGKYCCICRKCISYRARPEPYDEDVAEYADFRAGHRSVRYLHQLRRQKHRDFLCYNNLLYLFPGDVIHHQPDPGTFRVRYTPVHATCLDLRFSQPVWLDMERNMRYKVKLSGVEVLWRRGKDWQKSEDGHHMYACNWRLRFPSSELRDTFWRERRLYAEPQSGDPNPDDEEHDPEITVPDDHYGRLPMRMRRRHDLDCTTQAAMDVSKRTRRRAKQEWHDVPVTSRCKKGVMVPCKSRMAALLARSEAL